MTSTIDLIALPHVPRELLALIEARAKPYRLTGASGSAPATVSCPWRNLSGAAGTLPATNSPNLPRPLACACGVLHARAPAPAAPPPDPETPATAIAGGSSQQAFVGAAMPNNITRRMSCASRAAHLRIGRQGS
jgi:hypothetical protein